MWKTGYILNPRADFVWFLGLPYLAILFALGCQRWLPAVAVASIMVWITIPHHFATWLRAYGITEDRNRWKLQLYIGPLVLFGLALLGVSYAPITLIFVTMLWDKQHALMQQYGFSRIYDFKANTGSSANCRFDFSLNWVLYGNLFLTSPLTTPLWLRQMHGLHLPLSADAVISLHAISWCVTIVFLVLYIARILVEVRTGHGHNPIKYLFLAGSYILWYYTAWHTHSALVFMIAAQLMHGIQYIVISYVFTRRRTNQNERDQGVVAWLVRPGNIGVFLGACMLYALIYQIIIAAPLAEFGFGIFPLQKQYPAIPSHGIAAMGAESAYSVFAAAVVSVASLTHFYFDSFIWKVRDATIRKGL